LFGLRDTGRAVALFPFLSTCTVARSRTFAHVLFSRNPAPLDSGTSLGRARRRPRFSGARAGTRRPAARRRVGQLFLALSRIRTLAGGALRSGALGASMGSSHTFPCSTDPGRRVEVACLVDLDPAQSGAATPFLV